MADKELMRFTLTLNMDIPLHKQVWKILSGIQRGSRTEYVCKKIIGNFHPTDKSPTYRDLSDEKQKTRTVNALLRLGYRYNEIHAAMGDQLEDE